MESETFQFIAGLIDNVGIVGFLIWSLINEKKEHVKTRELLLSTLKECAGLRSLVNYPPPPLEGVGRLET